MYAAARGRNICTGRARAILPGTCTAPWPAAIGYRRFYQGILVRHRQTRRVAYGTAIRLASMSVTAGMLALTTSLHGPSIGAIALAAGVLITDFRGALTVIVI